MGRWLWVLATTGCSASEAQVQASWEAFLADNQACTVAEACVVIYPGCPLGCFAAVSATAEASALETADDLIARYERGGKACAYDCLAAGPVRCEQGTCVAQAAETY